MRSTVLWVILGVLVVYYWFTRSAQTSTATQVALAQATAARQALATAQRANATSLQGLQAQVASAQRGVDTSALLGSGIGTLAGSLASTIMIGSNGQSTPVTSGNQMLYGGSTGNLPNTSQSSPDSGYADYGFTGGGSPSAYNIGGGDSYATASDYSDVGDYAATFTDSTSGSWW